MLSTHSPQALTGLGEGYWHTQRNQMLDRANRPVRIAGVNWYGFETTKGIPGGLEQQDYHSILQAARRGGFNTIRLPFSNQMVESPIVPTAIQFSNRAGAINTDLKGLNSLQILDRIVAAARQQGLKIVLDNHRSEAGDGTSLAGLWFSDDFPESAWIADWQMLARRYANDPTVLGMDLRNEPHSAGSGGACWSCGGPNDWHLAAARAGNAVLAINPHLLIFVEGVDGFQGDFYWWGGNLEGVATAPVRLAVPNQLVYSPHDYGPVEASQRWFTPAMTANTLRGVWTDHWAYISDENIAPVWLGEFGVVDTSGDSLTLALEAKWFQSLVGFLAQRKISWAYWPLNGEDHYGILNANYDDVINPTRQQALASIQFPLGGSSPAAHAAVASPSGAVESSSTGQSGTPASAGSSLMANPHAGALRCHVTFATLKDWKTGFNAEITVQNTGATPIDGWKLNWTFDGDQKIEQLWSGRFTQDNHTITLSNEAWNAAIPPSGKQAGIGFNAAYTGQNHPPTQFSLNGTPCR